MKNKIKKVLVTGCSGTIGYVIKCILRDYELYGVDIVKSDFPNFSLLDITNYKKLREIIKGKDVIIHLAIDSRENFTSDVIIPENKTMIENVYRAALETKPHPLVIMASSTHVVGGYYKKGKEEYTKELEEKLKEINKLPIKTTEVFPDSPYGATKAYMEALGKYYSINGLDVICIRFGAVGKENKIPQKMKIPFWLGHKDLNQLLKLCIEKHPKGFNIFHGVSNDKVYDISDAKRLLGYNPLGR